MTADEIRSMTIKLRVSTRIMRTSNPLEREVESIRMRKLIETLEGSPWPTRLSRRDKNEARWAMYTAKAELDKSGHAS